jgi:hypothetical protein
MSKFRVGVREVHVHFYDVECDTEEEAKDLVDYFDEERVEDTDFVEYSHNLRADTWSVEVL